MPFYILYEVERPEVLKTDGAKIFGKTLGYVKAGQKDPVRFDLCVHLLQQHFFRIGSLVFLIFCVKLRYHNYSKLREPTFLRKLSFA